MVPEVVWFYHLALVHPGATRLYEMLAQVYYNDRLRKAAEDICRTCEASCQQCKALGPGYGHLPPRQAMLVPWYEVALDLIGPWVIRDQHGNEHTFMALTIIHTVTNYPETAMIRNKTAEHIGMLFENVWLSRYLRPVKCVFDQGNEFLGSAFQDVLLNHGIEAHPVTVKNPQGNSIVERLHQTIGNLLHLLSAIHPPKDDERTKDIVNTALQTAAHAALHEQRFIAL
jgi:transposase InsO family protein